MKKLISQQQTINLILALLTMLLLFHILILIEVIPYTIVWAGKIRSVGEMKKFELISFFVNVSVIVIFFLKACYIQNKISTKILNAFIWLIAGLFCLNTVGNLFAESNVEFFFFTPVTFILSLLCLRLLLTKA